MYSPSTDVEVRTLTLPLSSVFSCLPVIVQQLSCIITGRYKLSPLAAQEGLLPAVIPLV